MSLDSRSSCDSFSTSKKEYFFEGDQTSMLIMLSVAFTLLFCKTAEIRNHLWPSETLLVSANIIIFCIQKYTFFHFWELKEKAAPFYR